MPITLATHLKLSRCGVYYFRMRVPANLREVIGKHEILVSLRSRNPTIAKKLAYSFATKTYALFESMAYDPRKFNPADSSTFPTADKVRRFEVGFQNDKPFLKTDGTKQDAELGMVAFEKLLAIAPKVVPSVSPAPAQWVEPAPTRTIAISKASDAYLPTLLNERTRKAAKRSIDKFIQHLIHEKRGDIDIHLVRPVDVSTWKPKLIEEGRQKRTADNDIQFLQGLLKWAFTEDYIHHTTKLATEGKSYLTKKQRKQVTKGAEEFSVEKLNMIFEPTAYKKYTMKYGYDHSSSRYWIPLIALHTGMRKEEIAQLKDTDIRTESNIDYFDISTKGDRSLKTENAPRVIPIHDTLLKLGFMDYVRSHKGKLFEETGNAVSKAFIRLLEEVGVKPLGAKRAEVLHSMRDTFNNVLERAGVGSHVRLTLMGHEGGDTNRESYLSQAALSRLKVEGIDKLVFVETVAGVTHRLVL